MGKGLNRQDSGPSALVRLSAGRGAPPCPKVCLYTRTPDPVAQTGPRCFLLSYHPGR